MKIGRNEIKMEKRVTLSGWDAARISILAIFFALTLLSLLFFLAGVNPLVAYQKIFSYAFANPFGLPLTINRSIFLLFCTFAFIIPYKAGLWNIGMTGQLFAGSICAFAVVVALGGKQFNSSPSPWLLIPLMMIAAILGGAALGAIAGLFKGRFNVNEIVTTMMLNFITFWLVSFLIKEGGPFMKSGGEGESFGLPKSIFAPLIKGVPFTIIVALGLAVGIYYLFAKTKIGYEIKTYGLSPVAARYAGMRTSMIPLLVFAMGGALAGLAGYHYFAAVPGLYKIPKNYGEFGDLAFYGIICGLISRGNPLAAIPVALLFGGLSAGGRFVQGQLHMNFGVDYALLGVLMISLVAFQFFYRFKFEWIQANPDQANLDKERIDVGVRR
jgi:general nucleoside transport system permease protein